jgi:PhzF family phenazine biosynthesis protein
MPRYAILDAFAAPPRLGNPAAVVLDPGEQDDAWRQAVAAAFGFSETAFARPLSPGRFSLRWFTPQVEVSLCGHATLATVQALSHWGRYQPGEALTFETLSGELHCGLEQGQVRMDFPALAVESVPAPQGLLRALGLPADAPVFKDREDYLVLAPDVATVRALTPDFKAVALTPCRGVCVCAPSEAGNAADFVSRFFGPRVGINEDPVTGSAHCRLGPFWSARLGKTKLLGEQASERGGLVGVELAEKGRLWLSGKALLREEGQLQESFPGLKA